jgi:hypothetical protein
VRITKLYFQRFGLAAGDRSFINFLIRREAYQVLPIRDKSLSASQATADLCALLAAAGVACPGATDKSVKMSGVTAAFAAGASSEEVMHIGRCRPRISRFVISTIQPILRGPWQR